MILKELFEFVWDKVPWWGKWPVVILLTPTALIFAFLSWHSSSIEARIQTHEDKQQAKLEAHTELENAKIQAVNEKFSIIDGKLNVLILKGN